MIAINYFYFQVPQAVPAEAGVAGSVRKPPLWRKRRDLPFRRAIASIPVTPGLFASRATNARIGLDKFAADLVGHIDRIEVADPSRWIRQGQRLVTIHSGDASFDLLSPVEGVVMAVNDDLVKNPATGHQRSLQGWMDRRTSLP